MPTLAVPSRYTDLAPVIVTSPTARCGTTLVQRLLSASDNGFIYGEEIGHQIRTVTVWLFGLLQQYERDGRGIDEDFARALAGVLADWRPGLTAPTAVMQRAWVETFYQLPFTLADYSRSIGRPVWGFKTPGFTRDMLRTLLSLMPKARVIYVFRDLHDVLKSAKARRFVVGDESVAQLCADWARNIREVAELDQDQRVLFLKYEDLVGRRGDYVRLLELFTGAANIAPGVFDLKINTYAGQDAHGHSPSQYIAPAELTDKDRAAVIAQGGEVMEHFYGSKAA